MKVDPALTKQKGTLIVFSIFLILLFFFARFSNWNFDEVWTYYGIEDNSPWDIITYSKFKYANNHLFNSIYFKLLQAGSVKNIVVYRILGIGGSCLFFLASIKILDLLKINRFFVIILLVAPYFHILFLGRGYSLSMACFSISLYCLLKYAMGDRKTKYEYGVVVFGGLASLSLFSFLFGYFAMLAVLGYFMLRRLKSIHTFILGIIVLAVSLYVYRSGKIVNDYDPYINGSKSLLKGGLSPASYPISLILPGCQIFGFTMR